MNLEYLDTSDIASEKAISTVIEILKTSKVKIGDGRFLISVLEPAMPSAIKALYNSGFHRTTSSTYPSGYRPLTLRRLDIIVEVAMPRVIFGSDTYVKKLRKSEKLTLRPMGLSKAGLIAKTQEDSLIDISYASMRAMYEEKERLNAWRNHMQFTLPKNGQVVALIALLDRCLEYHESGSAVDYDRYEVSWERNLRLKKAARGAMLTYVPSSGRYELEVKGDGFAWSSAGSNFNYPKMAADLKISVERQLEALGDTSQDHWLTDFHRGLLAHFNDLSSPHYEEAKHLV